MWSYRAWRRRRTLARTLLDADLWQRVRAQLPILDGLSDEEHVLLRERASLFLYHKRLSPLHGLTLSQLDAACLAAMAELPLLHLQELDWYRGFREILLYPDDFVSPQRYRDAAGVEHQYNDERSGEAWHQGPVILAWPGVQASGSWDAYNLVIHELAHKLDMLNGEANGLPPLHREMRIADWAAAMQPAFDRMNRELDANPDAETAIDPYAAENPAEFFAVTSEYFFSAPDLLLQAWPAVYQQLALFYRQDPAARLAQLHERHPDYRETL
jgi:Mlc titration factor MtfA (ptsG expression regulator)